ncbi:MAG TPA: hypothetical protein VL424_07695, partial [Pararobbsia sp.]|nr:hypothetical protein [Pararobbsia sp.]
SGAVRPNALLVPQRAVLQGSKSHFLWVVDSDNKPHQRVVEVGEWHGDDWFVTDGLRSGERVIVDGAIRVTGDSQLNITGQPGPASQAAAGAAPDAAAEATQAEASGAAPQGASATAGASGAASQGAAQ